MLNMINASRSVSFVSRSLCAIGLAGLMSATSAMADTTSVPDWIKCRSTSLTTFNGTLVEAAVATPELSTLVTLVQAANLVGPLSGKGPFTVFAPTNAAFEKVPTPLLNLLGSNVDLLTGVLTYHVTTGTVDPRKNLVPSQAKTLNGQTVFVGFDSSGASVNQSTASCKGVRTSNGTVWVIDSVLLPQFK